VVEPIVGQLLGGLRVPVLIGPSQETLTMTDFEIVRGSSAQADIPIFGEDPSGRWYVSGPVTAPILGAQDGSRTQFRVRNYPIVDGNGLDKVTTDVSKVTVLVNGKETVVSAVNGAQGLVTLLSAPADTDVVSVTYYFRRKDTRVIDNVSAQITQEAASLVAPRAESYPIVLGSNDVLLVHVNDAAIAQSVTFTPGSTRTAADLANDVNAAAITGLTGAVHVDAQGLSHLRLVAQGNILIGTGSANGILGLQVGDFTNRNKAFRVFNGPIVDGSDGGITTTDPSKVVVLVNGMQVLASAVDGANGTVTLAAAPRPGSSVTVQYWFNTWQDTFDYLPNSNIVTVGNVGIAPGRRDFVNGSDFVVVNDRDQSKIQWGTSFQVTAGDRTGSASFGPTQVVGQLVDDRVYAAPCERFTDPVTSTVSTTKFVLPLKPKTGNGRDTPLGSSLYQTVTNSRIDLPTNRPDLVTVYVGKDVRDALARPSVVVTDVDSATNTFTLRSPVPADYKAFATFWYNRIQDDRYTLSVLNAGPSGVGKFSLKSQSAGASLYGVRFGTKSGLSQSVAWPSGNESIPDAFHFGGAPVSETVTVAFSDTLAPAKHASFSNASPEPYDVYAASQIFGGVVVDGNAAVSVNLSTAFRAQLLSEPVSSPGTMAFLSTDRLVLQIDGVNIAAIDVSAATSLANVATAINSAVDADAQAHADGTAAFNTTTPNALASVVTFGAESILKIVGRNVQSSTNGFISNVKVLSPTGAGQTDAAPKVRLAANQESLGSFSAINQPARMVGTKDAPFAVTAGVNDLFVVNVDGADHSASLPAGTAVPLATIAAYVNAGYAATAPAADQATLTASLVTLANELRTDYEAHRVNVTFHAAADNVNTIAAASSTDLATAITLLNDWKAKYNAHRTQATVHANNDTVNIVSVANATDLRSALVLAFDCKAKYNAHRTQATVHGTNDTTNIVSASVVELVASQGLGSEADQLVLTSRTNSVTSIVGISPSGTANDLLGLSSGAQEFRHQPTAADVSGALNANSGFNALAVAYSIQAPGLGRFLKIDSRTAGTSSTVAFTTVATSALIPDTGLGIVPGSSGDAGEAAQAGFAVTSTNPLGSGGTGVPGQTYTDARTGLRFTVLRPSAGDYANAGQFTLLVDTTFTADASIPFRAIPGMETTVFNTVNVGVDSTAIVSTFPRDGAEPAVGDVYYVGYNYAKSDLSTGLFRDSKKIQQSFGPPTTEFPLSLAARLALLNGAILLGLKQVVRSSGSGQAPVSAFTAAIDELRKPIAGSVKPDVIAPLGTDPSIAAYLNQHCVVMSSPRMEGERMGVMGTAAGTTPSGAKTIAQALNSELMILSYPDTFVISVQDDQGNIQDQLVDGSYMAAAIAGSLCNPTIDVATPLTRRAIIGFKRLGRVLDPTEANLTATAGVSLVEQVDTGIRIRHGLTTRVDNVITRTPSVTMTIQFVQQSVRRVLDPFIGQKFTGSLIKSVENALTGMFSTLIDQQIISKVAGISAFVDEEDPTVLRTQSVYVPVFPLEYIVSTLSVRVRL
jgi:hypothetical protein